MSEQYTAVFVNEDLVIAVYAGPETASQRQQTHIERALIELARQRDEARAALTPKGKA